MTELEQAKFHAAHDKFEADLAELRSDPHTWSDTERASLFFLICRARYEAGDNGAILETIYSASVLKVPAPPWAMDAFSKIYDSVLGPEAVNRSWDQAFGKPIPKGKHLSLVRNGQKSIQIFTTIEFLRENGEAVDAAMFESVGRHFGIDKTTCEDLYYKELKILKSTEELLAAPRSPANF